MRYVPLLFCLFFVISSCVGNNNDPTPKLELNVASVNFCYRQIGETVVWNDVQVKNIGKGELTLSTLAIRGDAGCAFQVTYPDIALSGKITTKTVPNESDAKSFTPIAIPGKESILLRVEYTPSEIGVMDRADLIVTSNAPNTDETVVIPMCGTGARISPAVDAGDEEAPDASVSESGDAPDAGWVPGDCEDCGELLEKGAPHCEEKD